MVRVYEIVNPSLLKKHERAIKQVFFAVLKIPHIAGDDFYFAIDEKSGWIVFKNRRELFRTQRSPALLPATKQAAIQMAGEILKALQGALLDVKKYPFTKELNSTSVVPTNLKEVDVVAVPNPTHDYIDQLLCRFQAFLPLDKYGRERVQVLGAQVDIRLGHQSQLISYSARWSPLGARIIYRELFPLESMLPDHEDGHQHDSSQPEYKLVYVQDNFDKNGLAPYYFGVKGGHHGGFPSSLRPFLADWVWERTYSNWCQMLCLCFCWQRQVRISVVWMATRHDFRGRRCE